MKKIVAICMVTLLVACGGQTPKTEGVKKDSIVSARDVANEKKAEAMRLVDSLQPVLDAAKQEEAELAAWVIEHAVELKDDAPEVLRHASGLAPEAICCGTGTDQIPGEGDGRREVRGKK